MEGEEKENPDVFMTCLQDKLTMVYGINPVLWLCTKLESPGFGSCNLLTKIQLASLNN